SVFPDVQEVSFVTPPRSHSFCLARHDNVYPDLRSPLARDQSFHLIPGLRPSGSSRATDIQPPWRWFSCTPISYSLREYPHRLLLTRLLCATRNSSLTPPSCSSLSS